MIKSMTGYGAAEEILNGRNIRVEIKSVNHRYFEYSARVPRSCGFLEDKLNRLLSGAISRGKVDVGVLIQTVEGTNEEITINKEVAKSYIEALRSVKDEFDLDDDLSLSVVARFPDVFTVVKAQTDEDALWADVESVAKKAVAAFVEMREIEGEKMKADVLNRAAYIEEKVGFIEKRSPETVKEYRERLYNKMLEVLEGKQIDEARIIQEAAIYSDKVAVDEETVRLRSHIAQLREIVEMSEPVGRKLDFLIQEVNREINTTGSKCSDVEIAQVVVDVKSEIEKIREQIQNIEYDGGFFMKLVNIGFGNLINANRVIAMVSPESAPIKRIITEAREKGTLIDASFGRKTKTVLVMDSGHVILSGIQPETVGARMSAEGEDE